MNLRSLQFVCIAVAAAGAGCAKESVVEVPAGHRGLVCSNDDRPQSCGLWLHDPGKLVIREDEKLRLIDCSPFVRTLRTNALTRDAVTIAFESDASYEVTCSRFEARQAFLEEEGDVGADRLFAVHGQLALKDALKLASTAYLSHEIMKEPERLSDLSEGIVRNSDANTGPLKLKRFMVTSITLRLASGEDKKVYDIRGN